MICITMEQIDYVKDIDLIQYVLDNYKDLFYQRESGDLVYKPNRALVVYKDHAYDFGTTRYPYKDSIYIEELCGGSTFVEAVERIEVWKKSKEAEASGEHQLDIFENIQTRQPTEADIMEQGFMYIPDGMDSI